MIKSKSKKTILDFAKRVLKLIKDKDERYINLLSIETTNVMSKIAKDPSLASDSIYLDVFYDGKRIVGGVYGVIRGREISDLHSVVFDKDSYVAKADLSESYNKIANTFEVITFCVVKGSCNEKFHDALFKRYAKRCVYQYKVDNGSYMNIVGVKSKLLKYKIKLIK